MSSSWQRSSPFAARDSSGDPLMPDVLCQYAEKLIGPVAEVRFCREPHLTNRVWRVRGAQGVQSIFVKQYTHPRSFRQEQNAYVQWCSHLSPHTPRLLRVCDEPPFYALFLSDLSGQSALDLSCSEIEEEAIWRQAGAFLRQLHDLPFKDTDPLSPEQALEQRCAAWMKRAKGLFPEEFLVRIQTDVRNASTGISLRRVPSHRDFSPRNWQVQHAADFYDAPVSSSGLTPLVQPQATNRPADGVLLGVPVFGGKERDPCNVRVAFFDFEHARPDIRELDFHKTYALCREHRESLFRAMLHGYGLDAQEALRTETFLRQTLGFYGLATVVWGCEHEDADFEALGRYVLDIYRS